MVISLLRYIVSLIRLPLDTDPLPATDAFSQLFSQLDFNLLLAVPAFGAAQIVALAVAVLALFCSAFVSGCEIAFFSLSPTQVDDLEEEDSQSSRRILQLLARPERLLATILIANNLVNVTIVVLCNFALGPIFQGMGEVASFVLQTVLLTFLILLFGEILPKLYANYDNVKWTRMSAGPLSVLVSILRPLSSVLVKSSVIVKKVVPKKSDSVTADDLEQALEIADVESSQDKEILQGILRFGDTTASEVMTPRVDITGLEVDASFEEVMKVIIESGFARLPVYDDTMDNIKGVLYSRDLLPYVGREDVSASGFKWQSLMREPYYVSESRMIDDLLEDFRSRRVHLAIVIDEYGGTQGIVTLEDVLEEIVGDIDDEYDVEEKTYHRSPDGSWVFEGKTLLNDFFRVTELDEDDYAEMTEDCETLAGMLLAIKGDFPKDKESIVYGRCRFLVLSVKNHRIVSVRVRVMNEVQPDQMKQ